MVHHRHWLPQDRKATPAGLRVFTRSMGFRVGGLGFRVWGSGFRIEGLGHRASGLGFRA